MENKLFGKDKIGSTFQSFSDEDEVVEKIVEEKEELKVIPTIKKGVFDNAFKNVSSSTLKVVPKEKIKVQPELKVKKPIPKISVLQTKLNSDLIKKVPIELQEEVNQEIEQYLQVVSGLQVANTKQAQEFKISSIEKKIYHYTNTVKHLERTLNEIKKDHLSMINTLPKEIVEKVNNDIMQNVKDQVTNVLTAMQTELQKIVNNQINIKEAVLGTVNYIKVILIKSKINELEIGSILDNEELDDSAINKMNSDLEKLSAVSKQCTLGKVIALLEGIK